MNQLRYFIALWLGKILALAIKFLNLGGGSTWPGHLSVKIYPSLVRELLKKNQKLRSIIVCGTNGKTSTASLIRYLLEKLSYQVIHNKEGANLLNGIASVLVKASDLTGKIKADWAVFEVDEFSLPVVLNQIRPHTLFILNLFRDQLDRYGEVNTVLSRWKNVLEDLPPEVNLIINGDDPQLSFLGRKSSKNTFFFGISPILMPLVEIPHEVDFNFCPICRSLLNYRKIAFGHLGDFYCSHCRFKRERVIDFADKKINYPLGGLYNQYNIHAVMLFFTKILKADFETINQLLIKFPAAFGRQEVIHIKGREAMILLSKNPAGFNQSLRFVEQRVIEERKPFSLLFLLNDRIPDGLDISWIWDIEFKKILFSQARHCFFGGDRVFDMALRIKYENIRDEKSLLILENLNQLPSLILDRLKEKERLYIFANYSAMLTVRKILVGSKFSS